MAESPFEFGVFINCPFDDDYRALFEAIVFAIHDGSPTDAIKAVRHWLSAGTTRSLQVPGSRAITHRFSIFRDELPATCEHLHLTVNELAFNEYVLQVEEWLKRFPQPPV